MSVYDVAIIGGGVVGCSIARALSQYNLKTVVIEKDIEVGFGTSKSNSGIVHSGHHTDLNTLKGRLVVPGNAAIQRLSKELHFGFRKCGSLTIAKSSDEVKRLEDLCQQGLAKGVPMEMWDKARVQREEPSLQDIEAALFAPTAAVINPYEFVYALMTCAEKNGVKLLSEAPVSGINKLADGTLEVLTPKENVKAKFVLNCAGVFADKVEQMVGLSSFTIKPRKGEEYLLDAKVVGPSRVIFPLPTKVSKGILLIPTVDRTLMVGPTANDVDDPEDWSTSQEGFSTIFNQASQLCPNVSPRAIIASFAGVRAASSTGDFVIEPTKVKGFINVAGIQSPGLTAAPAIADYVVDILAKEGLSLEKKASFQGYIEPMPKFYTLSEEDQKTLAERDERFSRVVCRCELVTEGDVHAAIDMGARCLDGVKFRTRAGMGRCQGGFCTAKIVEIISERTGIPPEKVTKRGGNSFILDQQSQLEHVKRPEPVDDNPLIDDPDKIYEVAVVGGGPAGLAAAVGAREEGASEVIVFDREPTPGGILLQCIHSGFGLHRFKEELTGPEYAGRWLTDAIGHSVNICANSFVLDILPQPDGTKVVRVLVGKQGVKHIKAKSVVLACGCRERTRAAIRIQGPRPSGIFTAGLAQKFVNMYGYLPGKNIVILGSGDIGLVMARRMTLEHCNVLGVFEIMPHCNGLPRNVVQCLDDYNIPLHLGHTVVKVHGKDRLEKVTIAPVTNFVPDMSKAYDIECDCLLLSVGLIPDTELSQKLGLNHSNVTTGPLVASNLMTSMDGVFACGNVLHVHDLVDNVSEEGLIAGRAAARHSRSLDPVKIVAGDNVGYVLPTTLSIEEDTIVSMRVRSRMTPALVKVGDVIAKKEAFAVPAEMVRVTVKKEKLIKYLKDEGLMDESGAVLRGVTLKVSVEDLGAAEPQHVAPAALETEAPPRAETPLSGDQEVVHYTCVCCPKGCQLTALCEGSKVLSVTGNSCPRGAAFAKQERVDPRRLFSTIVPIEDAIEQCVPVKLTDPVPKEKIIEAAKAIHSLHLKAPVAVGDVVLKNLVNEGVDVVVCRSMEKLGVSRSKRQLPAKVVYAKQTASESIQSTQNKLPQVAVIFGSQTDTAAGAADELAAFLIGRGYNSRAISADKIDLTRLHEAKVAIWITSTVGEGDFPDNFESMWEHLNNPELDGTYLSRTHTAVFGLGNSMYPKYQAAAKALHKRLLELGANMMKADLGLGDEQTQNGYRGAFMPWRNALADTLCDVAPPEGTDGIPHGMTVDIEDVPMCYVGGDEAQPEAHNTIPGEDLLTEDDEWQNVVLAHKEISKNVFELKIISKQIATYAKPGQYVLLRADERSERTPISIVETSPSFGWFKVVVKVRGYSTSKLATYTPGNKLLDVYGPAGRPIDLALLKQKAEAGALMIYGYGLGNIQSYIVARALLAEGVEPARLTVVLAAEHDSNSHLFLEQIQSLGVSFSLLTPDAIPSESFRAQLLKTSPSHVVASAPNGILAEFSEIAKECNHHITCHVRALVIDGMGICGEGRMKVAGSTVLADVHGPWFEGTDIEWGPLLTRMSQYKLLETQVTEFNNQDPNPPLPVAPMRVPIPVQDPTYRVTNFDEVALGYTPQMARAEAMRCLQCKNPTCEQGCGIKNSIKAFIRCVQKGQFAEAGLLIRSRAHPFPSVTGRVCPQEVLCEGSCELKRRGLEPVAIGRLERFVGDWVRTHGDCDQAPQTSIADGPLKTKRVAVLGAGPAGLTCAWRLAREGALVTVFEANSVSGGLMRYGIPKFVLPDDVLDENVEYIRSLGVEFRFNFPVGQAASVSTLLKNGYDAVFMGTGASWPMLLGVPGEDAKGVYTANEYLFRINALNAHLFPHFQTPLPKAADIVVFGGGNTAVDAARCARRAGAANVVVAYRRTRTEMPARDHDINCALEEGVKLMELVSPVSIHTDPTGGVSAVKLQRMVLSSPDASGRSRPVPADEEPFSLDTQLVIVAIGQTPATPITQRLSEQNLGLNPNGTVKIDENGMTSIRGLFSGGDAVSGPKTVVSAMNQGKEAAVGIVRFLSQ